MMNEKRTALYTHKKTCGLLAFPLHFKAKVWIPKSTTHLTLQIVWWVLLHFLWLLHWTTRRRNPILINGNRHRVTVHRGNVMDTWSFPLFLHCILAEKVFLSMASYLSWCSCHNNIPWNASPISLAKFAKPNKKQPVTDRKGGSTTMELALPLTFTDAKCMACNAYVWQWIFWPKFLPLFFFLIQFFSNQNLGQTLDDKQQKHIRVKMRKILFSHKWEKYWI